MKIFLTIKNYRCFVQPVTIEISDGFTAFVGINNAGKSTIMRFLVEFRSLFSSIQNSGDFYSMVIHNSGGRLIPLYVSDNQEVFSNLNNNSIEFSLEFKYEEGENIDDFLTKADFEIHRSMTWNATLFNDRGFKFETHNAQSQGGLFKDYSGGTINPKPLLEIANNLSRTLYIGPFRNTINVGTNTQYLDIQIGESFIKQFKDLKLGSVKANNSAIARLTSDIIKIFEFNSLEINPSADDKTLHINVNGKPYNQHELGSGLQQFIIVMANALIKKPTYVLIDEPELNLHPKLQLDFLTTLGSYSSCGVWFSTHSIGLARSAAQQVYSVSRIKDGDSVIKILEGTPRLSEFLGEMSFSNHKELGFDKILLVEGSTDVAVFKQFLRKMSKDHKVLLLPLYGHIHGGVTDQLEEIKRITPNINVIIDSEKSSEGEALSSKRQDFIDLCNKCDVNNYVLKRRAIENYFPGEIVKRVFGDVHEGLGPYDNLKTATNHWIKPQNYKLAKELDLNDLKKMDFYNFLESL